MYIQDIITKIEAHIIWCPNMSITYHQNSSSVMIKDFCSLNINIVKDNVVWKNIGGATAYNGDIPVNAIIAHADYAFDDKWNFEAVGRNF